MPDDEGKVQVVVKDKTLWCTQKAMAQLFAVGAAPCLPLGALKVEPLTFNAYNNKYSSCSIRIYNKCKN